MKPFGLFTAGMLVGSAGLKLLCSSDAKKVYAHTTAAALRVKESVMETVTTLRENVEDVYAEALDINAQRAERACAEEVEDTSECASEAVEDETAE